MDEALSWGPPRAAGVVSILLGVAAGGLAAAEDPLGRLLFGVAALLFVLGGGWLFGGPPLAADVDGVRIRGVLRTYALPWAEVNAVLVDDHRRSRAVELETEDRLLAVPALLLGGVSPTAVARELQALRGRAPR